MSPALRTILVVVTWCAIAGSWAPQQLLAGLAVALVVQLLIGGPPTRLLRTLLPILRLSLAVLRDLVVSSIRIAFDVLRPRPQLRPRVVVVETDLRGPQVITALCNAISLTPGSLAIEADAERGRLLIHLCYGDEATQWARAVEHNVASQLARMHHAVGTRPHGSVELRQ